MFDSKHYIPILKWKHAEQQALQKLSAKEKEFISPLIQLIMPQPKRKRGEAEKTRVEQLQESIATFRVNLPDIPAEILNFWGDKITFVDVSLLDVSVREQAFDTILNIGAKSGAFLIPVVSFFLDTAIKEKAISWARKHDSGICLRLSRFDFSDQTVLAENIKIFLKEFSFSESNIDLLVDFQITDEQCLKLEDLCKKIPNLLKWRTFTFASGAFPIDLSKCEIGVNNIARLDWEDWSKQVNANELERSPSFSDYTIQHPIYKEALQFFAPSASIKYTLKDRWLIMRGQKGKNIQYLANAQLLAKHQDFFGANFSYGDFFIEEKGKDLRGKPGNSTQWLVAGINHHLACTVNQISNLP